MLTWYGQHHDRADNGYDRDKGNGKTFATPTCRSPGRSQDTDDLNDTEGNVEKNRLEVSIAEVADDEIPKGGYTAACYALREMLVTGL